MMSQWDEPWDDDAAPDEADRTAPQDSVDSEPCPQCGQWVYEEADKCPYCGEWLIRHRVVPRWVMVLAIVIFVAFLAMILR